MRHECELKAHPDVQGQTALRNAVPVAPRPIEVLAASAGDVRAGRYRRRRSHFRNLIANTAQPDEADEAAVN